MPFVEMKEDWAVGWCHCQNSQKYNPTHPRWQIGTGHLPPAGIEQHIQGNALKRWWHPRDPLSDKRTEENSRCCKSLDPRTRAEDGLKLTVFLRHLLCFLRHSLFFTSYSSCQSPTVSAWQSWDNDLFPFTCKLSQAIRRNIYGIHMSYRGSRGQGSHVTSHSPYIYTLVNGHSQGVNCFSFDHRSQASWLKLVISWVILS